MATVLVVEDDAVLRELMTDMLREDGGYEMKAAGSTNEAVALLQAGGIDIVVTALGPHEYKTATWERLDRFREVAPKLPIIVCTADSEAIVTEAIPPLRGWVDPICVLPPSAAQVAPMAMS